MNCSRIQFAPGTWTSTKRPSRMDFDGPEGCRPGVPVAPRALRFELKEGYDVKHKTALLRWWPSQIFDENGNQCQDQKIVGYRIYVNGQPKGMVKAHKNRAMVEGLRLQHEYKITVVALGTLGESPHSNAAIIYVPNIEMYTDEKKPQRLSASNVVPLQTTNSVDVIESTKLDTNNKYMITPKIEVESIEEIIRKIKKDCNVNTDRAEKENLDVESATPLQTADDIPDKKDESCEEDYQKLLNDLDEETDEDIIEKVLKRYGLNGDDFNYATPTDAISDDPDLLSTQIKEIDQVIADNCHEISLD